MSTAIVNIKEDSLLSSTSSLATFSKAAVSDRSQGGTSRYNSPLDAPRAGSSFFRKRPSSSACRSAKRGRGVFFFLPPHHPGQSLGSGGGISAPKGSLQAGSACFAGLLQQFVFVMKALRSWRPVINLSLLNLIMLKIHLPEGGGSASSVASGIQIVSSVHGVRQSLPIRGSLLWSLRRSSRGSWLRFRSSSTVLDSASALSARLANSGVLPRVGSFFSEDVPPVVQFSRNSRRLGEVSACGASEVVSSSESYWTLSVSGLLQPGNESTSFSQLALCFCHEWINLRFLARVVEDAVLSDCHSGGAAVDAVVPVALHRPCGRLDSEALVRWSSEIRQDLFWWWAHERLELFSSLGRVSPSLSCGPTLLMSVGFSSQSFSGFLVDPESVR